MSLLQYESYRGYALMWYAVLSRHMFKDYVGSANYLRLAHERYTLCTIVPYKGAVRVGADNMCC